MADSLKSLSETIGRSKAYIIKNALQAYLDGYSDYLIAQERLNDRNDKVVSCDPDFGEMLSVQFKGWFKLRIGDYRVF